MEFKLNKIDTDIRQRINDATKEGRVHGKEDIQVNRDKNQENKPKFQLPEKNAKKKFSDLVIEASKEKDKDVKIDAENEDSSSVLGRFIDIRK